VLSWLLEFSPALQQSSRLCFTKSSFMTPIRSIDLYPLDFGCKIINSFVWHITNKSHRLAELSIGIIVACVPTLRSLVERVSKRFSSKNGSIRPVSTKNSTHKSSNSYDEEAYKDFQTIDFSQDIHKSYGDNETLPNASLVYNKF
jgi:hypothetical protein